jgi:GT2 family glycosyltransferase
MDIEVTVSLVACNQRSDLERLLPSLVSAIGRVRSEILLVDNRSTDGTSEFVQHNFAIVQIISNPNKAGYGENHNLNLQRACGRYFVIMNSDMLVTDEVFVRLRDHMDKNPDIGILSPKILNSDGSIQGLNKRQPTLLDLFLRRFIAKYFQSFLQRRLDYYEMRDIGYDHSYDVPFLSGAFMFCRTELLKSLNGFDSSYFLYFEDADLCRRVQRTYRTVYYPVGSVTHFWKRSAHKSWLHTYYFIKSAFIYFNEWGWRLY